MKAFSTLVFLLFTMISFQAVCQEADTVGPAAPSSLTTVYPGGTKVVLHWVDNSDNEEAFDIFRSTGDSVSWTYISEAPENSTTFEDESVTMNRSYYYLIVAYNADGRSDSSNIANVVTGVNGISKELEKPIFKLYPNPSTGNVFFTNESMEPGVLTITDINGRIVNSQIVPGQLEITIPTSGLENGVYFIALKSNHSLSVQKLIVK
ncbi:MAG: T9SS type A sorting domain-containing protein [Bacteroidota bacterium]|nr:T9SS type A sorting domain-containing protein [Bacteroidota bacterium]